MIKKRVLVFIFSVIAILQTGYTQEKRSEAENIFLRGFQMAEDGKIDKGLMLMEEAMEMEPDNLDFAYEVAYFYTVLERHGDAIEILEKLVKRKDCPDIAYQMLGNNYDFDGDPKKAIETYKAGLKRFPKSGKLYLELGNMESQTKNYKKALGFYEQGIKVEPYFPSNYINAATLHMLAGDKFLAIMYSEIFMNLERDTKRTVLASNYILNFYNSAFSLSTDSTGKKNIGIRYSGLVDSLANPLDSSNRGNLFKGIMVYFFLIECLNNENEISFESVCRIRENILNEFYDTGLDKTYYNAVFDWQKQLKDKGLFNAYNHWIMSLSDMESFKKWSDNNNAEAVEFLNWYESKGIPLEGKDGALFIKFGED